MFRILKILIINILLFCLLFLIIEVCLFSSFKKYHPNAGYNLKEIICKETIKESSPPREPQGLEYVKRPIILSGCSYIYGLFLEGEHTPHYKLSKLTTRPVFNYALPGKGLQYALYLVKNKLYDERMHNPEYFIYVMMDDHIRRMYTPVMFGDTGQPVFNIDKNGIITLKYDNLPIYRKFYTYYFINNILYSKYYNKRLDIHQKNVFAYFREMNRLLKEQFPDIKFVIILYDDYNTFGINFNKLKKEGFIILQTKELTGVSLQNIKYYVAENDTHPVEAAWDIIIPALVNKLEL